ncbi:Dak1 domain-domain-containing protein [Coniella lustricola]|uniref:Dak1 domain-domain-containing protein n=1 Tax=Coniella lustricola TaxID=2025994 RepID=A0A2T3A5G8_9PEZI|nr:Dak1 domain-domain-containing protein [Coniella lustricola]
MSDKHFFPETAANTLVPRHLRALTIANPHLALIDAERVVYNRDHDVSAVSIISGGGSGHEPGWSGFVGNGALAGAACGDIFASPSTKQVLAAMKAAPSEQGHILMITNYTGDKLHFGLAAERAKAQGLSKQVAMIHLADDVSIGRSKCSAVGRRGLPGHVVPMKITGAAAAKKYSFDWCVELGRRVNDQVVSIGSALDHCHVPGRQRNEAVPRDVAIVGAGIHNEPGAQKLSPFPTVENLIQYCLKLLCDPNDAERYFVEFQPGDENVLVVNNYGGLSNLELGALTDETITQLETTWNIKPVRILTGAFETSLNAPGFSISLCNLSAASRETDTSVAELLELLDAPTTAVSWPNLTTPKAHHNEIPTQESQVQTNGVAKSNKGSDIVVDPFLLKTVIRAGCEAAIAAEPNLTKWDMVMGDGDCGEAVEGVSRSIMKILEAGGADKGSIVDFLNNTTDAVDDMGGTLGAILGILLSAFVSALKSSSSTSCSSSQSETFAISLAQAVTALKTHTSAREGDRTVMDVLLPFSDDFAKTKDFFHAVEVAKKKAEATRFLKAKFGRATYVAEAQGQELPDPGAWALYEWLNGMAEALKRLEA